MVEQYVSKDTRLYRSVSVVGMFRYMNRPRLPFTKDFGRKCLITRERRRGRRSVIAHDWEQLA